MGSLFIVRNVCDILISEDRYNSQEVSYFKKLVSIKHVYIWDKRKV